MIFTILNKYQEVLKKKENCKEKNLNLIKNKLDECLRNNSNTIDCKEYFKLFEYCKKNNYIN